MKITLVGSSVEWIDKPDNKSGGYNKMTVTYKTISKDGKPKVEVKSIMDWAYPMVFKTLSEANPGDAFDVKIEKINNFWNWTDIKKDDGSSTHEPEAPKIGGGYPVKSTNTYAEKNELDRERFAFDKLKQPLIVRQSCLSSAVDLCKDHGSQPDTAKVLAVAQEMFDWVMRSEAQPD